MKRISILLSLSCLVLLCTLTATATTVPVFAHSEYYNTGYSQGQARATADYYYIDNGHNEYKPFCPTNEAWSQANGPHSSNFCAGFIDGYNAQRTALAPHFMIWHNVRVRQSTSQDSSVNIKSDNNRVTVDQQVNNNIDDQNSDGSSGSGREHSSYQPNCKILCSIIRVN